MNKFERAENNKGALVNTDTSALHHYKLRKKLLKNKESEISSLRSDVEELKRLIGLLLKADKNI